MQIEAFEPFIKQDTGAIASKRISLTSTSSSTLISDLNGEMLRLANIGSGICYITFSKSSGAVIAANDTCMAIMPGATEVLKRPQSMAYISGICDAAGTTTLNVVAGTGL